MTAKAKAKISHPALRITELVKRPGGIPRAEAIRAATAAVETLRSESIDGMAEAVASIEEILAASNAERVEMADLVKILRYAERIVTLAETFGFELFAFVAKSCCDLAQWFSELGEGKREPLSVHVRSLRLTAPPRVARGPQAEQILAELSRILTFFGCIPREETRVDLLRALKFHEHELDGGFNHLLELAQRQFAVPVAAITLIDAKRQWFSSDIELNIREIARNISLCMERAKEGNLAIIEDIRLDPEFSPGGEVESFGASILRLRSASGAGKADHRLALRH